MIIRIRKRDVYLHVVGDEPRAEGDKFFAVAEETQERPTADGCRVVMGPGYNAFVCRRGSRPRASAYRFDPKIHEVID